MKKKLLTEMTKKELLAVCKNLELEVDSGLTNESIISIIESSEKGGVRIHPKLGEWKKCIVNPTETSQQKTDIFVGNGKYEFQFKPFIEVELPEVIIKGLKDAVTVDHTSVRSSKLENGIKVLGEHSTKKKYIVEVL